MASALNDIASPQAAVGYFVDTKKGEVNELKQLLKNLNVERDIRRKREVIKKVIAYMTLGIDVKRLFTDMIMAVETKDIVIKKMVYFYLSNYANSEPDMAIMCINTLRRDCDNEDPLIRGLALRSLCSLRLESILEYVTQPLQKAFADISAYVRKTAVLGVLKLHYLSPQLVENNGYLNQLYNMLQDVDALVVTNAIYAIHEMKLNSGGIEITPTLILALLNRIGEFSEWGLNLLLDLVARYEPRNEEEMYGIMNLLDPILRTANSGSVLATVKCFLTLTNKAAHEMYTQVLIRAKPPLLTIVTGGHHEAAYVVLKHIEALLHQPYTKTVFDGDYRQFFIRYNEPSSLKHLKAQLLPLLVNESNVQEIANELHEYVTDVDSTLSAKAIHALGEMIALTPTSAPHLTNGLLSILDMQSPALTAQVCTVLCDILRVHPSLAELILPCLEPHYKRLQDSSLAEAKVALVWILGEFGGQILSAPYLLEHLVDGYEEEVSVAIKTQLLSSVMKLFFARPPEMQKTLGRLFRYMLNDTKDQDLHDKALLYYRLLQANAHDLSPVQALFAPQLACINCAGGFAENREEFGQKKVFSEFNTLAVVFANPSEQFVAEEYQLHYRAHEKPRLDYVAMPSSSSVGTGGPSAAPTHPGPDTPLLDTAPVVPVVSNAPVVAAAATGSVNLLDWDDGHTAAAPAPAPVPTPAPVMAATPAFLPFQAERMNPGLFQQHFTTLAEGFNGRLCVLSHMPSQATEFDALFRHHHLFVLASGPLTAPAPGHKFFLYAHQAVVGSGGGLEDFLGGGSHGAMQEGCFVAQVMIFTTTQEVQVVVKATPNLLANPANNANPALVYKFFLDKVVEALHPLRPQIV